MASNEIEWTETFELVTNQLESDIKLPDNDYTARALNDTVSLKKLSVCVSYLSNNYLVAFSEEPDVPLWIKKGATTAIQERSSEEKVYGFGIVFTKHLLFTPKIEIKKWLTDFSSLLFILPKAITPQKVKMVLTQDVQKNDTKTYLDVMVASNDEKKKQSINYIFPRRMITFFNNLEAPLKKNKKNSKKEWQQTVDSFKEDFPFFKFPVLSVPQLKEQSPYKVFQTFIDMYGKAYCYATPLSLYLHKIKEEIEEEKTIKRLIYLSPLVEIIDHEPIKKFIITINKDNELDSLYATVVWSDVIEVEEPEAIESFKIRMIEKEDEDNLTFTIAMRLCKKDNDKVLWEKTATVLRSKKEKEKEERLIF